MSYQPEDRIRLTSNLRAVVIGAIGDKVEVRVDIPGWCQMLATVRRDEIVEACAECQSAIGLDARFELRDDGKPLCPDCYQRLYGQRDREDAQWQAADFWHGLKQDR